MKGKNVFISGGAGVIGQEMVPLLLERGAKIFVGDLKPRPLEFPKEIHYRQGDLNYLAQDELDSIAPDIFIHLAATFERSHESYEFWEDNFNNNIRLSNHLMTLAKYSTFLRRVIYASSYLIYDPKLYQFKVPQNRPYSLKENDPILPRNLTGMAKLAHEIELRFLNSFKKTSFNSVCVRIFRGYGCNSRDVISRWIQCLLEGKPITVYRPEGIFDYIYAKDSAEGIIRIVEAEHLSGVINLGTGNARRVRDVIDILAQHFPGMQTRTEETSIDYEASQADMSRYKTEVGWIPEYSLESAIAEIIEYEKRKTSQKEKYECKSGNVLINSSSKKVPLVIAMIKAAQKLNPNIKIIAGDINNDALSQYVADEFWHMPRTLESEIDDLLDGCKKREIKVIYPTRDGELLFWSNYKTKFEENGIKVLVPSFESVKTCLDKLRFSQFGQDNELPVIPSAEDPNILDADLFVVKERYGAGASNIGINLNKDEAIKHGQVLNNPIYQPYIAGIEASIDAWLYQDHSVKGLIMRTRDYIVNGESQVSTTFHNAIIEKKVTSFLETLKLSGHVVLQVIVDPSSEVYIIECNPRFGGASTTAIAAGLDSFYWSLLDAYEFNVEEYPFVRNKGQVRQIRVPQDIYQYDSHF